MISKKSCGIFLLRFVLIISPTLIASTFDVREATIRTEKLPLPAYNAPTPLEPLISIPDDKLGQIWKDEAHASVERLKEYESYIQDGANERCCVESKLIQAMIIGESHARDEVKPRTDTGACGPLQITKTAKEELVQNLYFEESDDRCDIETNIKMGITYMWYLENTIGIKDTKLRIIAYNEGPSGAMKYAQNPNRHKYLQRIAYSYNMLK